MVEVFSKCFLILITFTKLTKTRGISQTNIIKSIAQNGRCPSHHFEKPYPHSPNSHINTQSNNIGPNKYTEKKAMIL